MEPKESAGSFIPVEGSMQALYQSLDDTTRGEFPQEEFIWQGSNPPFGFVAGPNIPPTTPNFCAATASGTLNNGNIGNYASFLTLGYPQQLGHHFLGENSSAEFGYSGSSIERLGNSSVQFIAPHETSTSQSNQQNLSSHLPSHGMTTARGSTSTRRSKAFSVRPPGSRIHVPPMATSRRPYHVPSRTEFHDVPNPSLMTNTTPVTVQPISNEEEDIERHIGQSNDEGRWFCTHCNKKSDKRRNRIWDHVAACLGYEIYRCTGECGNATCEVKCKTRQNLREHKRREHRKCPECGETVRRQNLIRHMSNKHHQGT